MKKGMLIKKEIGEGVTVTMKNVKTCFDCLHCKVAARSKENRLLCFCSETEKKERHKDHYWLAKKVCGKFEDMTA